MYQFLIYQFLTFSLLSMLFVLIRPYQSVVKKFIRIIKKLFLTDKIGFYHISWIKSRLA